MKYNRFFILVLIFLTIGCSVTKLQTRGNVVPQNFHYKTQFTTSKSLVILPAKLNGVAKNYLFDTGAQLTLIQTDTVLENTAEVTGASKRKVNLGLGNIESFQIGEMNFQKINALHGDLVGLKEQIPNFGGIIGQSIISKANWLIDYPNSNLEISNKDITDSTFQRIEIVRKNGSPYTFININGKNYKAIIDLGASKALSIPEGSKLAEEILKNFAFEEIEKESYTIGGNQTIKKQVGILPIVKLGNLEITNVQTDIKLTSEIRIGISFFKEYIIYIDNINNCYKIKECN
jgi:hypothetical protein